MTAAGSRTKRSGKQRETCDFATSAKPWCQRTTVRKIGPFARCETERIAIVERVGSINQSRTKCEREIVGRGLFATGRMCQCVFVREAKDCKTRLNNGPVTDFDGPSARLFGCFCGLSPQERDSPSGQEHESSSLVSRSFIRVGVSSRWITYRECQKQTNP